MIGAISNIIVIILIFTSVFVFTLPDHILAKIPLALETRNFLEKTFSQSWDLSKTIFTTVYNSLQEAGVRLKDGVSEGYDSTRNTLNAKYEASRDLVDAWGRLTD